MKASPIRFVSKVRVPIYIDKRSYPHSSAPILCVPEFQICCNKIGNEINLPTLRQTKVHLRK